MHSTFPLRDHLSVVAVLSVREHQYRTVENVLLLRKMAPDLPIICVLQGWRLADYQRCVDLYRQAGLQLDQEPIVGLGSVCRRQSTEEIGRIADSLPSKGIHLHGFGVKTLGLRKYGRYLASADSMTWSFRGRHIRPCPHSKPARASCSNCLTHATKWREKLLEQSSNLIP
jgi:hypothetical protein